MGVRCVNLDWLEVYCLERGDVPRDANYFASRGLVVREREYGTPVYESMFTILDDHLNPFIEVRRKPKSKVMHPDSCHIRLHNSYCYADDAAQLMSRFLDAHGFEFLRISRVDICLDFEKFDGGDNPQDFITRYIANRYSKINQANLTAHARDTWGLRHWNSLSWGSPTSQVGTKLYNKTLELFDPITKRYGKPWIRYAWLNAGLIDDMQAVTKHATDGSIYTPVIWRLEFSVRSSVKGWLEIELDGHQRTHKGKQKNLQSIKNTLDVYDSRQKILMIFASLAQHYFHFKYYQEGVRKDRCPDKVLFRWGKREHVYTVEHPSLIGIPQVDKAESTLLSKLRLFRQSHDTQEVKQACDTLIRIIMDDQLRSELNSPFRQQEIAVLRLALSYKMSQPSRDIALIFNEVRELLKINDRTLPPYMDGREAQQ